MNFFLAAGNLVLDSHQWKLCPLKKMKNLEKKKKQNYLLASRHSSSIHIYALSILSKRTFRVIIKYLMTGVLR